VNDPIGVAVLGAGFIAEYHLAGIAAAALDGGARATVHALAARSTERAAPLASRFGIADVVADWRRVLDRSDVDAVVVCTPDHTHEEIATAAAQAGKAILLQKPMAGTVAACERIIAAAKASGVDLQVSFMHRFFPEVAAARTLLADGVIGRVHSARIRNATPGPDWNEWFFANANAKGNVGGGVVDQLGVHGIDLALQFLGDIRDVSARVATLLPTRTLRDGRTIAVEVPDTAFANYTFDGGGFAAHEMSMIEMKGCDRFRLELYGDAGTMWLRSERGALAVHAPARFGDGWRCPALPPVAFGQAQHRAWLDGIAERAPRLPTARDALRGMQVVEAIRRSTAAAGTAVRLPANPA
jgi:predicted dehydrogenase